MAHNLDSLISRLMTFLLKSLKHTAAVHFCDDSYF